MRPQVACAALCLSFPTWAVGGLSAAAAAGLDHGTSTEGPSLLANSPCPRPWAQQPRLPSPPHSGVHKLQSNIQARVGKSWRGTAASGVTRARAQPASGVSSETEEEGPLSARLAMATGALSWRPVVPCRLTTGCLNRAARPPVTSPPDPSVAPSCSYLVGPSPAAAPSLSRPSYRVNFSVHTAPPAPCRHTQRDTRLLVLVHIFNKISR